ncbi:zinc finger protein 385C isoform X2 [Cynoglossus semilaevis]|uniref:zinc finger protein 385C isoform X2 n=1 Tax=Cynoglossus semilaevis TaxID=244447 RepID=UPI0004960DDD|nr:zinc finger protein 385C isoform X2 [Cynoglossus semilaevis]
MESSDTEAGEPFHTDMKQPKSPEWVDSTPSLKSPEVQEAVEADVNEGERKVVAGCRVKRERRQTTGSATMCQVCNIHLNSSAQAQIHCRGKTHQRRLRRLAKAVSTGALSHSQVHPLLGSLPLPARPLQSQPLTLPLRVNGSTPLSLFPNFNAMDPVQKAVISHTFGVTPPKKKPIISCNVCHLRFNSTNQAEAHYKGHKHARKLKALESQRNRQKNGHGLYTAGKDRENGTTGAETLPASESHSTDRTGSGTVSQPAQQQSANVQGCSPATTDPSDPPPKDSSLCPQLSPQVSPHSELSDAASDCPPEKDCRLTDGSDTCCDAQKSPTAAEDEAVKAEDVKEAKNNKKHSLHCPTCKVTVNSSSQLEAHCSGSKHKQMLDGHNGSQSKRRVKTMSLPRPIYRIKKRVANKARAVAFVSNRPFHCELCQVSVNSETQLKQHMNSRRHRERLAGKPMKAKFMPYNKLRSSAVFATKLALQKQLSKALPAGLLTAPLNPAALCTMAPGPLALRLPSGPSAIIQGPLFSPSLFRPAPGPLRATHTPIIFSPY